MTTYPLTRTTNSILAQAAATGIQDRRVLHSNGREDALAYILQCIDTSVMPRHLIITVNDEHQLGFIASARSLISVTDVSLKDFSDLIEHSLKPSVAQDMDRVCVLLSTFSDLTGTVRLQVEPYRMGIDPAQSGITARQLAQHLELHPNQDLGLDNSAKFEFLLDEARDYILAARRTHEEWHVLHAGLDGLGPITDTADALICDANRLGKIMKGEDSLFLNLTNDVDLAIGIVLLEDGPAALLVSNDATTELARIWSR